MRKKALIRLLVICKLRRLREHVNELRKREYEKKEKD